VAAGFVETSQLFARTNAAIDPAWLEEIAHDLCVSSWSEPVYEERSGRVRAMETVRLFGLIIDRRKKDYARAGPAQQAQAREVFIQEALVAGRLRGRYRFLQHNQNLVKKLRQEEERLRARGLVVDDQGLAAFYDQALPAQVYDRPSLNRFLRRIGPQGQRLRLFMNEQDLRLARPDGKGCTVSPYIRQTKGLRLPLRYRFEPGDQQDRSEAVNISFGKSL